MDMELDQLKRGFFLGRMIWIRGVGAEEAFLQLRSVLADCGVDRSQMACLGPDEFMQHLSKGEEAPLLLQYEAIVFRDLEKLDHRLFAAFLGSLARFRSTAAAMGLRLILVTPPEKSDFFAPLLDFSPVIIDADGPATDPRDLNSRAHFLLERACGVTRVPIHRISERAAYFLEQSLEDGDEREVLVLLVEAVRRSDGRVLRFRDILPQFRSWFEGEDPEETPCN
jgi:hypothetical protein